jgi:hypothetical protein
MGGTLCFRELFYEEKTTSIIRWTLAHSQDYMSRASNIVLRTTSGRQCLCKKSDRFMINNLLLTLTIFLMFFYRSTLRIATHKGSLIYVR